MRNVVGLAIGFAVGQGSVFLAFSLMLAKGEIESVAGLGIGVAALTLLVQIADWGMLTTMSRRAATSIQNHAKRTENPPTLNFGSAIVARVIATIFCVGISSLILSQPGFINDEIAKIFLVASAPSLLFSAFNVYGYIDGSGNSGMSGLISSLPWITLSAPLLLLDLEASHLGLCAGLGYTTGSFLALILQKITLRRIGTKVRYHYDLADLKDHIFEGASVLFAWLPGQLSSRVQIFAASIILPAASLAALVYIRQILNATNQLTYFFMRSEFPRVSSLANSKFNQGIILELAKTLAPGLVFSALATGFLLILSHTGHAYLPFDVAKALEIIAPFSVLVLTTALTGSVSQIMLARRLGKKLAVCNYISLCMGIALLFPLLSRIGLAGLAVASIVQAIAQLLLIVFFLRRSALVYDEGDI